MSNQRAMREYTMETPGERLIIKGNSIAARETGFYVKNLGVMLDFGVRSDFMPVLGVITHMHLDHFSEIERYLLATENYPSHSLTIICPAGSVQSLRARIEATFRATKGIPEGKPVPFPPHTIIGATIGGSDDSVIVDIARASSDTIGFESTTFRFTEEDRVVAKAVFKTKKKKIRSSNKQSDYTSCCCDSSADCGSGAVAVDARVAPVVESHPTQPDPTGSPEVVFRKKLSAMRKPYKIEAIRCNHGGIPTTGYGFSECRERIKDEYLTTDATGKRVCILSKEEMGMRKSAGTLADMKEVVFIPAFAYICDTDHKVFSSDGKNEGHKLDKYPVIIIECTFYDPKDKKKAKNDKHMHWDNLSQYISSHPDKYFKLIHHSQRYNTNDLNQIQKKITAQFPTPPGDTPHVVLCRNDNFTPDVDVYNKNAQKTVGTYLDSSATGFPEGEI